MCTSPFSSFIIKITEYPEGRPDNIIHAGLIISINFVGHCRLKIIQANPMVKVTQVTKFSGAGNTSKERFDLLTLTTNIERELVSPIKQNQKSPQKYVAITTLGEEITISADPKDKEIIQHWMVEAAEES